MNKRKILSNYASSNSSSIVYHCGFLRRNLGNKCIVGMWQQSVEKRSAFKSTPNTCEQLWICNTTQTRRHLVTEYVLLHYPEKTRAAYNCACAAHAARLGEEKIVGHQDRAGKLRLPIAPFRLDALASETIHLCVSLVPSTLVQLHCQDVSSRLHTREAQGHKPPPPKEG